MTQGFVYILQSLTSGQYYIGSTMDVLRRFIQHSTGNVKSTHAKGPWKIVFTQQYGTKVEAQRVELKLKKMKSRDLIQRIIADKSIKFKV